MVFRSHAYSRAHVSGVCQSPKTTSAPLSQSNAVQIALNSIPASGESESLAPHALATGRGWSPGLERFDNSLVYSGMTVNIWQMRELDDDIHGIAVSVETRGGGESRSWTGDDAAPSRRSRDKAGADGRIWTSLEIQGISCNGWRSYNLFHCIKNI